jgi:hypothetical protein
MNKNVFMKTKESKVVIIRGVLLILLSLYFIVVFGQSSDVISFNAARNEGHIALRWQLSAANKLTTVVVEKKSQDNEFSAIAEFWVNFDGNTETKFSFTDKKVKTKTAQYRLKLIGQSGDVKYSEALLLDKGEKSSGISTPSTGEGDEPGIVSNKKGILASAKQTANNNTDGFKAILKLKLKEMEDAEKLL